jgi:hypothetical protein
VNNALVLHGAVSLDDGAKIGILGVLLARKGEQRVVVRQMVLIDRDVAVGVEPALGRSSGTDCETTILATTMKMISSTKVMSTSGVTLMPTIPSSPSP